MSEIGHKEIKTQNQVKAFLESTLGYRYLGHWKDRQGNSNVEELLLRKWLQKRGYTDKLIGKVLRELDQAKTISGSQHLYHANRAVYDLLRYGVKVKPEINEPTETVWLIDWKRPENNDFAFAEEVTVEGVHSKRPDIVLYINGIAAGVLELKRSTVSVSEGIRQNLDSQKPEFIESFYTTVQFVMAGNDIQGLRYGVIETPEKYWLRWKEEQKPDNNYDPLLEELGQFCQKGRFLELIHDFIVFDAGIKKACRHNQFFGVKAAQAKVAQRESGIIWHTQGSGKSLTMVWLAKWIRENVKDARVLLVTDRKELDDQIEKVFHGVNEAIYRTKSGEDLVNTLNRNEEWLICSLVHKFGSGDNLSDTDVQEYVLDIQSSMPKDFKAKGNVFVFVDECHRTQSGKLNEAMKSILPDAMFIGFTGTPLLKKDKKKSVEIFGPYIHTYKFDEAVEDEVILDLRYEARDIDQNISSQEKIDDWFELKTKGLSDLAKAEIKKRWGTLQKVLSSRDRLHKIYSDILVDMARKDRLMNDRGNAMLVTSSIYASCQIYEMFQKSELANKCAIITSYKPNTGDIKGEESGEGQTEKLKKYEIYRKMLADHFNEPENTAMHKAERFEEEIKKQFVKEPGQMKLLIVVDKLLTGFDAPPATYLYIDKKMQDHGLFQAICRVNRLHEEDKEYGYIIDYMDLFKSLEKSIQEYTGEAFEGYDKEDVDGLLKDRLEHGVEKLEEARESIKALCEPVAPPYDSRAYQKYFVGPSDQPEVQKDNEPKRLELYKRTAAYLRAYANLANEMQEAGYSQKEAQAIKEEVSYYEKVRKEVKLASGDYVDMKMYEPAMRHLLDTYIRAEDSRTLSSFDDMTLVQLIVDKGKEGLENLPDGVKGDQEAMAETIESNVRKLIIDESPVNPRYYEKMSKLLNELVEKRRQEAIDYQEYLQEIIQLAKEAYNPSTSNSYPSEINTPALQALYDNLEEGDYSHVSEPPISYGHNDKANKKAARAKKLDEAIKNAKEANWRDNLFKKRKIRKAIKRVIGSDEDKVERIFEVIKNQNEY